MRVVFGLFLFIYISIFSGCTLPEEVNINININESNSSDASANIEGIIDEVASNFYLGSEESALNTISASSYSLEAVDDELFNSLSFEDKIYVAKKLYSTIFKGEDISTLKKDVESGRFISDFRKKLEAEVSQPDLEKIYEPSDKMYRDDTGAGDAITAKKGEADQAIVSRLLYTKLSKTYYSDWIAYQLNHTILLSPGWEVDTMLYYPRFILSNFDRLRDSIRQNRPVQDIVYEHMISVENWARFRSPEDNGREMLEIWLYDFDDSKVPLAAKVLKNWRFYTFYERPYQKYVFEDGMNDYENNETVHLLGRDIRTGREFFKAVVEHENFIYTVVYRIVGHFFPTFDAAKKESITELILAQKPKTFKDIFDTILFSKAYLFESDRVKSVEETMYGLMDTLNFHMGASTLSKITGSLGPMNQKMMTYKLGREYAVPVDTISMNNYAKSVREIVLINRDESETYPTDDGVTFGRVSQRYDDTNLSTFIDDIFLDLIGRKASNLEHEKLEGHFKSVRLGYLNTTLDDLSQPTCKSIMTMVVFDYISRLSELYQYRKVTEQE